MSRLEELIKELCPNGVEYKKIGDICVVLTGGEAQVDSIKSKEPVGDKIYPIFSNGTGDNSLWGFSSEYRVDRDAVTFSSIGTIGFPTIRKAKFTPIIRLKVLYPINDNELNLSFLKYALEIVEFEHQKSSVPNINANMIKALEIPVPPLPIQEEIVRILDNFTELTAELTAGLTAELQDRKKQYEYYRDRLLTFNYNVEFVETWRMTSWDKRYNSVEKHKQPRVIKYPTIIAKDLYSLQRDNGNVFLLATGTETGWTNEETAGDLISEGEVIAIPWGKSSPLDKVLKYYSGKFVNGDNRLATSNDKTKLSNKFLFYYIQSKSKEFDTFYRGSSLQHPDMNKVLNYKIPILPLDEQERIVATLDKFDKYCNDISEGLLAEIKARQQQYEYYRDKMLSFKRLY